jgi:hypothetical protein
MKLTLQRRQRFAIHQASNPVNCAAGIPRIRIIVVDQIEHADIREIASIGHVTGQRDDGVGFIPSNLRSHVQALNCGSMT